MLGTLTVMTFNIRGASYEDGTNAWKRRAELNIETILSQDADILGLQQVQDTNLESYATPFRHYRKVLGQPYNRFGRLLLCPIFFKADVLRCTDAGSFYLSQSPQIWSKDPDAARIHCVTWAELVTLTDGTRLLVTNTHLDQQAGTARRRAAGQILDWLAERSRTTTLLLGDFSSPAEVEEPEGAYRNLLARGFADTWQARSAEEDRGRSTTHGFQGGPGSGGRVDWILLRNGEHPLEVVESWILTDHDGKRYPSDHYPVCTCLRPPLAEDVMLDDV